MNIRVVLWSGRILSNREICSRVFDHIEMVNVLDSRDEINLALLSRPELGVTFTKLHCWRLTQYEKAVFMDADTLVVQNIDDLFEREELSAAPDPGWPDCFNSGVFVYKPSMETYTKLLQFALETGSFDGGDQGLLNQFFSNWATSDIKRYLSCLYNVISQTMYSYLPAFMHYRDKIKVVHFIGPEKPWTVDVNLAGNPMIQDQANRGSESFIQLWWHLFSTHVKPQLPSKEGGLIAKLAAMTIEVPSPTPPPPTDDDRQAAWERGHIDYLGSESFENIQRRLESKMKK